MTRELTLTGPVEVVGAGLLGTSIGLACRRAGLEVLLSDVVARAPPHRLRPRRRPRRATDADRPQLVVVAVPPDHLGASVIAEALARLRRGRHRRRQHQGRAAAEAPRDRRPRR